MNTKFSFVLLVVILIATACAPAIVDESIPVELAAPPVDKESSALLLLTGESASPSVRDAQESRQWSGEIFLSDNSNPDLKLNNDVHTDPQTIAECMSEDSQPRRQGGCTE